MRALTLAILGSLVCTSAHAQQENKDDVLPWIVKANLTEIRNCAYAEAEILMRDASQPARTIATKAVTECRSRFPLPADARERLKERAFKAGPDPFERLKTKESKAPPFKDPRTLDLQLTDPVLRDLLLQEIIVIVIRSRKLAL